MFMHEHSLHCQRTPADPVNVITGLQLGFNRGTIVDF